MITDSPTMPLSGLAIMQASTTGVGILPGIIPVMAGMILGLIPGSIPGIIALGTILGTTAMLAGIHLGITTLAGIGAGGHTLIPVMLL